MSSSDDTPELDCVMETSDGLPWAYPGLYNNLFPVKNGAGKTIRLVVVSAGYVMAFDVKHSFIPQVP